MRTILILAVWVGIICLVTQTALTISNNWADVVKHKACLEAAPSSYASVACSIPMPVPNWKGSR